MPRHKRSTIRKAAGEVDELLKVKIYAETDSGSRKRMYRGYGAVVEYIKKNGEPETRESFGLCEGTWNHAYILALADALRMLNRPCSVTICAANKYVCASLCSGRARGWKESGWQTLKGEPVADAEEWEGLLAAASGHELYFSVSGTNPYSKYMQNEMRKIKNQGVKWQQMRITQ